MRHTHFIGLTTFVLLAACTIAPTATPTATPSPTVAPLPTYLSTTATPRFTETPTTTSTPILITFDDKYQTIIWYSNFDEGEKGHALPYNPIIPNHYDYIEDPTGSSRGRVFMARIDSEIKPGADGKYRLYPSIDFRKSPIQSPFVVQFDVWIDSIAPKRIDVWGTPYLSLLSLFDTADQQRNGVRPWHPFALVNLMLKSGHYYPYVGYIDSEDNGDNGTIFDNAKFLELGKWSTIAVEVTRDSMALYVDGVPTSKVYHGSQDVVWAHLGLYSGAFGPGEPVSSAYLLNDNVVFRK